MVNVNLKNLKIKNHYITIIRRIVQISAFLLINYTIIQLIFSINTFSLNGFASYFPILQTPRSAISNETGILEMIFFQGINGYFPFSKTMGNCLMTENGGMDKWLSIGKGDHSLESKPRLLDQVRNVIQST